MALPRLVASWKWFYYAPNTYKELKLAKWRKAGKKIPEGVIASDAVTIRTLLFSGGTPFYSFWEFFSIVVGPYLLIHFFLFPAPLLALGEYMGTGNDMYRFRDGCRPFSGSFYLRQVLASVDFWTGS